MIKASRLFLTLAVVFLLVTALPAQEPKPSGAHYNLNVIGFAQCKMATQGVYPDCFEGNAGDIQTSGHTIFVPLKTLWEQNPCGDTDPTLGSEVPVAELEKGVRILVSDGPEMKVPDRDATDGLARFILPYGSYEVWAKAGGKPYGCMDLNTIICYVPGTNTRVDCSANLDDKYVVVGHVDVDRSTGKAHWDNVTSDLLPSITGTQFADYYEFFWQIYNNNLRLLQLRFYPVPVPE